MESKLLAKENAKNVLEIVVILDVICDLIILTTWHVVERTN